MSFIHCPFTEPGKELRLLTLLPTDTTSSSEKVVLNVTHVQKSQNVEYTAVSYQWGDPTETKDILINGEQYSVTTNLYALLIRLQQYETQIGSQRIYFWIDAICIDQQNLLEKSVEVSRMGEIYGSAQVVLAWIGPATDTSDIAISNLQRVGQRAIDEGYLEIADYEQWAVDLLRLDYDESGTKPWGYDLMFGLKIGVGEGVDFYFPAMRELTQRTYWNRVWMFQEASLPRNHVFVCGERIINGDHLEAGLVFFGMAVICKTLLFHQNKIKAQDLIGIGVEISDYHHLVPAVVWLRASQRNHPGRPLFELVGEFIRCNSGARDPRDRIFASWGLIDTSKLPHDFRPDYTLDTREVYIKAAKIIIQASGTSVLCLCHPQQTNKISGLPTWVPDWSMARHEPRFIEVNSTFKSRCSHTFLVGSDNQPILSVQGIKLDSIVYCTETYDIGGTVKLQEYAPVFEAERGGVSTLHPFLPRLRRLAFFSRKVFCELRQHIKAERHAEISIMLLRVLDDDEPTDISLDAFKALTSRNPIELLVLLSQKQASTSSEERCQSCTGGECFESRLDALLCPHLPIEYDSPDVDTQQDCFEPEKFTELFIQGNTDSKLVYRVTMTGSTLTCGR
jgi:Heterokaryon incompatibility protein (HET)